MILLGLNQQKVLNCRTTSDNYSCENNFEEIKVVCDKFICGKDILDYNCQLYISYSDDLEKEYFNDCIAVELSENNIENGHYIYTFSLSNQYTNHKYIGFYMTMSNQNDDIGKTNIVHIKVRKHPDGCINISPHTISLFEKYKKEMQNILASAKISDYDIWLSQGHEGTKEDFLEWLKGKDYVLTNDDKNEIAKISFKITSEQITNSSCRIWFKKNCENWSTPRIYLFSQDTNVPHLNAEKAWDWNDSPYMIQSEAATDLYYFDLLISQYSNVIFFCDKIGNGGFNYKTRDLKLPNHVHYKELYYWQSPIGFDGIWANKDKQTFNLYTQNKTEWSGSSNTDKFTVTVNEKEIKGINLSVIGSGFSDLDSIPLVYTKYEIPLNKNICISYDDSSNTIEGDSSNFCYNIPAIYVDYLVNSESDYDKLLKFFDASCDNEFLFGTKYSAEEYDLYRDIYKNFSLNNMIETETGIITPQDRDGGSDGEFVLFESKWFRMGNLVTIAGKCMAKATITDYNKPFYSYITNILPYVPSSIYQNSRILGCAEDECSYTHSGSLSSYKNMYSVYINRNNLSLGFMFPSYSEGTTSIFNITYLIDHA